MCRLSHLDCASIGIGGQQEPPPSSRCKRRKFKCCSRAAAHHPVYGCGRCGDEENLHEGIVKGYEGEEQVQIAAAEDYQKEDLRFQRHPPARSLSFDAVQQHYETDQMKHVPCEPKDIHLPDALLSWLRKTKTALVDSFTTQGSLNMSPPPCPTR